MQSINTKPEFYQSFYHGTLLEHVEPLTRYVESSQFWMFRYKDWFYKVRRDFNKQQSSFELLMAQDLVYLTNLHSPFWDMSLLTLSNNDSGWALSPSQKELPSNMQHFVYRMHYLSPAKTLQHAVDKKNLNPKTLPLLVDFLIRLHKNTKKFKTARTYSQDHWEKLVADLLYQSKKYTGKAVTQAILDIVEFPLFKFIQTHKKLLQKRLNQNTCQVHGCFIPPKIFLHQQQVSVLPHHFSLFKEQFQDVAVDIANLAIDLRIQLGDEVANDWVDLYIHEANDPDLRTVIIFHQIFIAMKQGLSESEQGVFSTDKQQSEIHFAKAQGFYTVAANMSQGL